jgi:hypothetical protein
VSRTAFALAKVASETNEIYTSYAGPIPHDTSYYLKCMLGGALACGFTHAGITPIDVAKCNMQVNPSKYKGLFPGIRTLLAEEGSTGIWKGFGPTFVGYSLQGMFKYGLYEYFKDTYANLAGEENAAKYKGAIWLAGSASAEVFADIALCPLEMTKVKIQTSPVGTFPTGFGAALAAMSASKIETRFPFGSLVPLWSRQVSHHPLFPLHTTYSYIPCRSPTPWPSSSSSRRSSVSSTRRSSLLRVRATTRPPSSGSPSLRVTLPVSSAPSSPTRPTRWSRSRARPRTRASRSARLRRRLALATSSPRVSVPVSS